MYTVPVRKYDDCGSDGGGVDEISGLELPEERLLKQRVL